MATARDSHHTRLVKESKRDLDSSARIINASHNFRFFFFLFVWSRSPCWLNWNRLCSLLSQFRIEFSGFFLIVRLRRELLYLYLFTILVRFRQRQRKATLEEPYCSRFSTSYSFLGHSGGAACQISEPETPALSRKRHI